MRKIRFYDLFARQQDLTAYEDTSDMRDLKVFLINESCMVVGNMSRGCSNEKDCSHRRLI